MTACKFNPTGSLSRRRALPCFGLGLVSAIIGLCVVRTAAPSGSAPPPVRYVVVVTGGELLAGAYPDGHTFFVTRTLRPLGLQCVGSLVVDDRRSDLQDALRFASDRADLVIVTGGLGPTDNDITREALQEFTGIALREHPDVLAAMARRFNTSPDGLRANLRRQTQVPTQGTYLKNVSGTAIGLVFEMPQRIIVALPGPPRELQPMVLRELVPYLSRRFGTRLAGSSVTLRFVGLGQSQIDQTIKDHASMPPDVMTSSQFEGGRVDFTFSLPGDTAEDRARLTELKEKIARQLGEYIYADNEMTSLEASVVKLLEAHGLTLALAEVGTGGALVAALNGAEDAPRVLAGACVAPTEARLRHLLDVQAGQTGHDQVAHRVAAATGGAWVIVVGEPRRADGGAASLEVSFRRPDGRLESRQVRLPGTGEAARARLVTELLDQLRRRLSASGPKGAKDAQ